MIINVAIIGFPNVGKTHLYNRLTKENIAHNSKNPFSTTRVNNAILMVTDEDIKRVSPYKITQFPIINLYDTPSLTIDSHLGLGLGNQFLEFIRCVDAIIVNEGEISLVQEELTKTDLQYINILRKKKNSNYINMLLEKLEKYLISKCSTSYNDFSISDWSEIEKMKFLFCKKKILLNDMMDITVTMNNIMSKLKESLKLITYGIRHNNDLKLFLGKNNIPITHAVKVIHPDLEKTLKKAVVHNLIHDVQNNVDSKYCVQNGDVICILDI